MATRNSSAVARAGDITVQRLTSSAELEAIRGEWNALWSRTLSTPFQSPAWLIPWWRHLGVGVLETLALRRHDELVALAPLYVYSNPESNTRDVLLVGCGTSDYLDVICEPGYEAHMLAAILDHLQRERSRWDRCEFTQLRRQSALLEGEVPRGWTETRGETEPCLQLPLPPDRRDMESVLPRHMSRNLRYYRGRTEKRGTIRIRTASASNVQEHFDDIVRLHTSRWAARGQPGVLATENVRRAHREALPWLLAAGVLRLYSLALDDRVIAAFYGLSDSREGGSMYCYLGAFDPQFEELSPGNAIIAHAVEQALAEGACVFDFLRGREQYKKLWGARAVPTYRRALRTAFPPA